MHGCTLQIDRNEDGGWTFYIPSRQRTVLLWLVSVVTLTSQCIIFEKQIMAERRTRRAVFDPTDMPHFPSDPRLPGQGYPVRPSTPTRK